MDILIWSFIFVVFFPPKGVHAMPPNQRAGAGDSPTDLWGEDGESEEKIPQSYATERSTQLALVASDERGDKLIGMWYLLLIPKISLSTCNFSIKLFSEIQARIQVWEQV